MLKNALPFCLLLFAPAFIQADDVKKQTQTPPTIVVRLASLDTLFDRLQLIGGVIGQENLGKSIDKAIKSKLGEQGLSGIDNTRPIGLYARVGADLSDISGVILVPVKNEAQFKEMLENLGWEVGDEKAGIRTVKQDLLPIDVQYRIANGYAYVGLVGQDALAADKILTPEGVFGAKSSTTAVSLTLQLNQISGEMRELVLEVLKEALGKIDEKAGGKDSQKIVRAAFAQQLTTILGSVLKDGDVLNADVDVDPKTKQMTVDLALTPKANTNLAQTTAALTQPIQFDVDLKRFAAALAKNDNAGQAPPVPEQASVDSKLHVRLEGGTVLHVRLTMGLTALVR